MLILSCAFEHFRNLRIINGKKSVTLKTTVHEKVRVSVCLAANTDGTKL